MKATSIVSQAQACCYVAWATVPGGSVRRLEVFAGDQPGAIRAAFVVVPFATAISARRGDSDAPLTDALADLDRRAGGAL